MYDYYIWTNLGIAFGGYISVFHILFMFCFSNLPTKSIPSVMGRKLFLHN